MVIIFSLCYLLGVYKLENKLEDYQLRFIDEYRQLKERCVKLRKLLTKYDAGVLDFTPKCNADILEVRAEIEGVDLSKYL
nr:MAG TPA: hypothetical protein [Bacteriophage sp.]